jgi:hypothetical protein
VDAVESVREQTLPALQIVVVTDHNPGLVAGAGQMEGVHVVANGGPRGLSFSALVRFAAAGFPVTIVPGNHDAGLTLESVRGRLLALLEASGAPRCGVIVQPWILHVPGMLYAEHGNQHHDINAFVDPIRPLQTSSGQGFVPLGSHISTYPVDVAQAIDPGGGGAPSLGWVRARARPGRSARSLRCPSTCASSRRLTAIRRASGAPARGDRARTAGGPERLPGRRARPIRPRDGARVPRPAAGGRAQGVPYYVLVHSHHRERVLLGCEHGPVYLNTGTVVDDGAEVRARARPGCALPFFEILRRAGEAPAAARLMRWNDDLREEPYPGT